jgi:hypothetical protein
MADNYAFDGANKVFTDREQMESGEDLGRPDMFVFFNGLTAFSRWRLSPAELEEINRTGEIVLAQLLGGNNKMPQTFVGSEKNVAIATMDLVGRPLPQIFPKKLAAND